MTRGQLREALKSGLVVRLLHGVYVRSDTERTELVKAHAAALVVGETAVLCDRTAAWVHGVSCLRYAELDAMPPLESCVLRGREPTERGEVIGRSRDLRSDDITMLDGIRVTTPLRTAADLLCLLPRREALAAADALSREHGFTRVDLRRLLVRYFRRRGVVQARQLAAIVDGRAESSGESWARLEIHDHHLPEPTPQFWVDIAGVPTYRLDLAYPRARIAVEYDGAQHHSSPQDRARDERRRAWLRENGWTVIVLTKDSFTDEAVREWIGQVRQALTAKRPFGPTRTTI
ncbi:MAG: DUF559 domain-containing protein [Nocardioides sp.]